VDARLDLKAIKIRQLIDEYRSGKIVIPEFQRDYVWKPSKAPKFLDSLYRRFPVSSLLIWQSTEDVGSRRITPKISRSGPIGWVIDGQQRLITLSRIREEGIDIVYNPHDEGQFALANAATRKSRDWIRLDDIWDDDAFRSLRRSLDSERVEAQLERVRAILDYEIPVITMIDHSFVDAVEAFTRINTLGMKLKKADIESAQVASKHTGFIRDEVVPFLEDLNAKGYWRISIMHLFRACGFLAADDGRTRTPLQELDTQNVELAWSRTQNATRQVISLLRSELGLVDMNLLWSGSLLVPLIALCGSVKPRELDPQALVGWLSLAALHHRYSGSTDTQLDADLKACRAADPIGALLTNLRQSKPILRALPTDFAGALNDRGGIFGAYVACQHRGVRDFFTNGKIVGQDNIDRHHILPRGQFRTDLRSGADVIANIAFITSPVNKSIGLTGPEIYMKRLDEATLRSQCVPLQRDLWAVDRSGDFFSTRRQLFADSFNEFIAGCLPGRKLG
jgi:hypothetical protein